MRWTGDIHTLTSLTNNIVGTPWKRLLPRKIVKREASRPDNELLAFSGGSQAIVDAKAPTLQETQVATQLDVESHWPS